MLVDAKIIENSIGEDKEGWMSATAEEIHQIDKKNVNTDYTQVEFNEKYGTKKIKRLFSKVVATKKPLYDGLGGQKRKVRICVCGNGEEGTQGHADENRAEVPATFEMKTLLTLAEKENWVVGALDIKTAFLHADLDDEEDGIYCVHPPKLLVRNGLVAADTVWKLNKVLYGLRAGPKKWTEHRDKVLKETKVKCGDQVGYLVQMDECKNMYLVMTDEKTIVGRLMVYVDDVLTTGTKEWVDATMNAINEKWECKMAGVLGVTTTALNFLGVTLELNEDGKVIMHQKKYILSKLNKRGLLQGKGKWTLPVMDEGKSLPVLVKDRTYHKMLKKCQEEIGTLMWLGIKTRPDIMTSVSVSASMQTKDPSQTLEFVEGVWKYLAMTWNEVAVIESNKDEEWRLEITTDASHAPGGDRSRTGVVILLGGVVLHWHSGKQTLTAMSTCESEIEASHIGVKLGMTVRALIAEATKQPVKAALIGDNEAALRKLTTQITNWRTRHFSIRAGWLRDYLKSSGITVEHRKGTLLVSDALTKVLDRVKLTEARLRLGLVKN